MIIRASPQSIRRRRFTKGKTHTVSYTLNHFDCSDFIQAIYDLEDLVGKTGTLVLHGRFDGTCACSERVIRD